MNIIIGICGGIAAYKVPMLIRQLKKNGHQVQCVATRHALQFVTPLTLETLSQRSLYCDLFENSNEVSTEHIALKDWGDMIVVAPATANIIGKMAHGIADDALSTLLLAMSAKPRYVCPAMNSDMLHANATQRNIEQLRKDNVTIIESTTGELACGTTGDGRMAEPEDIYKHLIPCHIENLSGKKFLITAGPTYERIDSVRFIGNYSSGKMGYAVAEALAQKGANVILISGPTHLTTSHPNIHCQRIENAQEMYDAATAVFPSCNGAVLTAAVADYRPLHTADHKLKKRDDEGMTLQLVQNPDILAALGQSKGPNQLLAGFALETNDEIENARKKLVRKNLDFIVLNSLNDAGAGFGVDTNKVTFLFPDGKTIENPLKSKSAVAQDIANIIERMLSEQS
ncbi:MAG: bifunctional phosphopantothenoylcysteine decarboxylase/phosphopantothenate--cysteine ligase CoaBC [Bacteroidales bacterium]|nr:bifunctional phosphopantothenoylcysteine decarboxylase/phosphopantothenate--cysteine ligase CoaBC [Bacteroidales bacterium]